jgi:TolA-binding protein
MHFLRLVPIRAVLAMLMLQACTAFARAQETQPMDTMSPAAAPASDVDAMAGPKVDDPASRTLVRTDMQNRFQRLDVRPEEAALQLLAMDPSRRVKAREIILARADALRTHLAINIDLVKEWTDAQIAKELYDRFEPTNPRDPLLAPLASVLTSDEQTQIKRLVDEYWEAWIASEQKASPKSTPEEIAQRLIARTFNAEVAKAYDSALRPHKQKLDAIITATEPTADQIAALRAAFINYIRASLLHPTDQDKTALATAIYNALDEPRRIKLVQASLASL